MIRARAPLVAVIASAGAVVSVWRYPVRAPQSEPSGEPGVAAAGRALAAAARARQPSLELVRRRELRVSGLPAVELDALERIHGLLRRVRSTHIFTPGAEIVLEEYAPPAGFHAVDHSVFSPLRRSLVITAG